jgi:hypothetical protein
MALHSTKTGVAPVRRIAAANLCGRHGFRRYKDREHHVGFAHQVVEGGDVAKARLLGTPSGQRAATFETGEDVHAVTVQHAADGASHVTRAENTYSSYVRHKSMPPGYQMSLSEFSRSRGCRGSERRRTM